MTQTIRTLPPTARLAPRRPRALLTELERPRDLFRNLTPNWYASIMGTGIVANAAATLPQQLPGLRAAATVVYLIAATMLLALTAAVVVHWISHPATAKSHHRNPVMAHFYGAPPMALLTVGAGTLLLGRDVVGLPVAIGIDAVLWSLGTLLGLVSAVAIPYLTFTTHRVAPDAAFGGWLMPIVPPMVSASTGALLLPFLPAGQARETMLYGCYAMFGLSLIASLVVIALIWSRLTQHKIGAAPMVPTLWIVLGPLGQSITAANLLGGNAHFAVDASTAHALQLFGVIYGVPVLGFAAMWAAVTAAITLRTARRGLPFSLTWWSFTFPVGTCVTGISGLAAHTGLVAFQVLAVLAFVALLAAWVTVAIRTVHGSLIRGSLFLPPAART
ncbi:TDT family transporter [Lysinimonas soli]|uniref:TDT family transporter n=1 Tax=Lysinimonas soli TaxID=1074233 RepID=A0ABW0NUT6_9MICO